MGWIDGAATNWVRTQREGDEEVQEQGREGGAGVVRDSYHFFYFVGLTCIGKTSSVNILSLSLP